MDKQNYYTFSAVIYLVIAIIYAIAVFNGGSVVMNSWVSPEWVNWVVLVVSAYMAYHSYQLKK